MPAADHRLTTLEMAQFVTDGYLRFDALIPYDLNRRLRKELTRPSKSRHGVDLRSRAPSNRDAVV